jgi:hypothetical protein
VVFLANRPQPAVKHYTSIESGRIAIKNRSQPIKFIEVKKLSGVMKVLGKVFPHVHLDPIQRDLLVVLGAGFLVAVAFIVAASFVFH